VWILLFPSPAQGKEADMRLALILCALMPCIAFADDARVRQLEYLDYAAVTADMLSTHVAVHNLGMEEGNPLLGKHPSDGLILASGAVRYVIAYAVAHGSASSRTKRIVLTVVDCVELGVVGSNLSTITHHDIPELPAIGIGITIPLAVDFWGR